MIRSTSTDNSSEHNDEMIGFSQNHEDIILRRIFANEGASFNVNIRACHSIHDSGIQYVYVLSLPGVNTTPQPELFAELARDRITGLNICADSKPGKQTLCVSAGQSKLKLSSNGANRLYYSHNSPLDIPRCSSPASELDQFRTYRKFFAKQACDQQLDTVIKRRWIASRLKQCLKQKDKAPQAAVRCLQETAGRHDGYWRKLKR